MKAGAVAALIVVAVLSVTAQPADAHPLGNFTTNTFAGLRIGSHQTDIDYVVDLAEIPAIEAIQRADRNGDGALSGTEAGTYATRICHSVAARLRYAVDGEAATIVQGTRRAAVRPGQAGLRTLRVECGLRADVDIERSVRASFADTNFEDRIGWHELVAQGDATTITGGPRSRSLSARLTSYPKGTPPLDERETELRVRPGGHRLAPAGPSAGAITGRRSIDRFTTAFAGLVARQDFTIAFGMLAILIATVLGATHALAPGHGKTVIAAYVLSQSDSRRIALLLGLTVALSHTAGVLLLGTLVTTSAGVAPERFYPALGALSGLLFVVLGVTLLVRARRRHRAGGIDRQHTHDGLFAGGHGHADDDHAGHHHAAHDHDHGDHDHEPSQSRGERAGLPKPSWRSVLLPGIAGGLVPSPSALLVYVGGLALGRTWFAVLLVAGYGIGIAATLVAAGYLLGRARDRFTSRPRWRRAAAIQTALPTVTAALVIAGGLQIAVRSLAIG